MATDALEAIPEGALNRENPTHLCPRCGDQARFVSSRVYPGLVVRFACIDGHQWSGSFLDLPADVLAAHGAAR